MFEILTLLSIFSRMGGFGLKFCISGKKFPAKRFFANFPTAQSSGGQCLCPLPRKATTALKMGVISKAGNLSKAHETRESL